jgi:acetoacetyl-CoA reductase
MVSAVPEAVLKSIIAQIPMGRLGTADEIAHCAVFLADDATSFMTGATLTANGAHYIAT